MGSRNTLAVLFTTVALSAALIGCGSETNGLAGDGGHGADATSRDDAQDDSAGGFGGDAGGGHAGDAGGSVDAALTPVIFGGTPDGGPGSCLGFGAGCAAASDCCGGDCAGGVCKYPACTSDHEACTSNGNCCSQSCVGGTCAPLNTTCKTLGNQCATGAECCSELCSNGTCQASSFCGQTGDVCSTGSDCCTGTCTVAAGATLGTCDAIRRGARPTAASSTAALRRGGPPPTAASLRNDAGLPSCGGACCSRPCAP